LHLGKPIKKYYERGEASEKKVGDELEPVPVKRMQPRQNGVVTRRSVGIVAGVPNRVLVSAGHDDDEPDVAGVEGTPLDTRQREWSNDFFRYVFYLRGRKVTVWIGYGEHILIQTFLRSQFGDSI